ncbi:MAG: hypothetical protein K2N05_10510 [Muribaculaceae bacterium]|nr:hypothetical protein [Muribaculaceae bacterium]
MKKTLLLFTLCVLSALPGLCAITVGEKVSSPKAPAGLYNKAPADLNKNVTRADGEMPEYMSFYLFIGESSLATYFPTPGENENQTIFYNVPVHSGDNLMLQSWEGDGYWYYAKNDNTVANQENPSIDLYFTGVPHAFEAFYGKADFEAVYNIVVDFEGDKATLTFDKSKDYEFSSQRAVLISSAGNYSPKMKDYYTTVYREIPINGDFEFYLYDSYSHLEMGWATKDGTPATPENMKVDLVANPEFTAFAKGLNGTYNITVEYAEDFSGATVSFSDYVIPDELANYTGDLYLYHSGDELADPSLKMTCVSPGIYEWEGETLKSDFAINGGEFEGYIPDTDIHLWFGPASGALVPGEPCKVRIESGYFNYNPALPYAFEAHDVKLKLDLHNMTLSMDGEINRMTYPIYTFTLTTKEETLKSYTADRISGDTEAVYTRVLMDNVKEVRIGGYYFYFGWPKDSEEAALTGDEVETTLFTADAEPEVGFVKVDMTGYYDIYLFMNEAQTEARLKFVKVAESGIAETASNVFSWRKNNDGIELLNVEEGAPIAVYSLNGAILYKGAAKSGINVLKLQKGETYIVTAAGKSFKLKY